MPHGKAPLSRQLKPVLLSVSPVFPPDSHVSSRDGQDVNEPGCWKDRTESLFDIARVLCLSEPPKATPALPCPGGNAP